MPSNFKVEWPLLYLPSPLEFSMFIDPIHFGSAPVKAVKKGQFGIEFTKGCGSFFDIYVNIARIANAVQVTI